MTKHRVTFVSSFGTNAGGGEQWLTSVIQHAPQLRSRAVVLADGPLVSDLRGLGLPTVVIETGPGGRDVAAASRRLWTELRRHRPDVVVANGVKAMTVVVGPALALGIPRVWIKHDHSFDRRLAVPLGRAATRVVATTESVGLPTQRRDLVVVEPPRTSVPLAPAPALAALAAAGCRYADGPTLGMIGRLVPYKGLDIGIMALAYPEAADWRLVAVGGVDPSTPGEDERLRRLAADLGVAERVQLIGPIPDAGRLVRAFDALAVLTRPGQVGAPQAEGFGITALEAMLGAVPVVAVGPSPIAERLVTPEGPAGISVPASDPRAVARALHALRDPRVRELLGARGRRIAEQHPDAQQVADRVVEVIDAVARNRP